MSPPAPLAVPDSLREQLALLRGPSVMRSDVDACLAALRRPLAGDETPRARADLLLALMEDPRLRDYTGSNGRTLRAAAGEALVALGYPYALELPPDLLPPEPKPPPAPPAPPAPQAPPRGGFVLGMLALMVNLGAAMPLVIILSERASPRVAVIASGLVLVAPVLAMLGSRFRLHLLRWVGVSVLAVEGLVFLGTYFERTGTGPTVQDKLTGSLCTLLSGVLVLATAAMLSRPWPEPPRKD